jgi:hypothetical protein
MQVYGYLFLLSKYTLSKKRVVVAGVAQPWVMSLIMSGMTSLNQC